MEKSKYLYNKTKNKTKNNKIIYSSRYILGITSLWLIIPFIYGIVHIIEKKQFNILFIILILWIGICCIISTLLGLNKLGSFIHKLDITCARLLFIILCIYFGLDINNKINKINIKIKIIFPLFVTLFYLGSVFLSSKNYTSLGTLSHIMFRFIGFWWCFIAVYSNIIDYKILLILSIGYFSHILLELDYIYKLHNFEYNFRYKYKKNYIKACIKTILFILTCLLFIILHLNHLKK